MFSLADHTSAPATTPSRTERPRRSALTALGQHLDPLINELGDAADNRYLEHPQWTSVIAAAQSSYETLRRNDTT